jgi:hypothetical protein
VKHLVFEEAAAEDLQAAVVEPLRGERCLAFANPAYEFPPGVAVIIGTLAQEMTEVVYDVRAEKVGFVSNRCD